VEEFQIPNHQQYLLDGRIPTLVKPFVLPSVELSAFALRAAIGALGQFRPSKFCFCAQK